MKVRNGEEAFDRVVCDSVQEDGSGGAHVRSLSTSWVYRTKSPQVDHLESILLGVLRIVANMAMRKYGTVRGISTG